MFSYNAQHSRHTNVYSQSNAAPSSDFDDLFPYQSASSTPLEASQSSRRPQCPECGTRKMRLRAGQLICKRGHVQQHFRIEQAEDDEFLGDGVARKRRTVTVNKVRRVKSQHTPYYSIPETDVEPDDREEEQLHKQYKRAHKRARSASSRPAWPASSDDEAASLTTHSDDEDAASDTPYSIRADSFFERPPRSARSYAASSAAQESGMDSEADTYTRASRRGIRSIWRSGVGLHGAYEGRFALLQCLQLVLRLQLHTLRQEWGEKMPPETEAVARDLWSMFVSLLPVGHFPPEPLIAATFDWHTRYSLSQDRAAELFPNHATYDPESDIRNHRRRMLFNGFRHHMERQPRKNQRHSSAPNDNDDQDGDSDDPAAAKETIDWIVGQDDHPRRSRSERSSESESLVDPEDQLASLDPVFAEERRQQRLSQAISEGDTESGNPTVAQSHTHNRKRRRRRIPSWATKHSVAKSQSEILHLAIMPTTISIIYLSLHLLKIPIFWSDLTKLIASYKLPYLNVVHNLPLSLTKSLNKDNVHLHHLDTDVVPSITTLHLHTLSVADLLQKTYAVEFGQGNVSGQLARLVEGMLLPPTFYVASKRVLNMVGRGVGPELLPKVIPKATAFIRRKEQEEKKDDIVQTRLPGATQLERVPKEFVLMSALLVVVKLRYGLDGRERTETIASTGPQSRLGTGISCAPLLEPWLEALDKRRERQLEAPEAALEADPCELQALHMNSEQVEAYAKFAEDKLILSNQIDLHEWRRLEPARQWAGFMEFMPSTSTSTGSDEPKMLTQALGFGRVDMEFKPISK
uniref:Uncharacterized protein n=1 Tax=Melanopsichium pennsylvanicum 4 TaxID=1398559 RepID=A0A077QZW1_9BASI|nr:conserved hypothetical protein [Melanopsichium pennsylvanicum 4]